MGQTRGLGCSDWRSGNDEYRLFLVGMGPRQYSRAHGKRARECSACQGLRAHLCGSVHGASRRPNTTGGFPKNQSVVATGIGGKGGVGHTLPGSSEPNTNVAGACAEQLTQTHKT